MLLPITSWIQKTNLIKEGSLKIQAGENVIKLEKNRIVVDFYNAEQFKAFGDREDFIQQMRHLSEVLYREGKTCVIKYRGSSIVTLGAGANSLALKLVGMDHVSVGNPVTLYRSLRTWRKD